MSAPTGALSDPRVVRAARRLRAFQTALEWGLYAVIAATVAAFGAVHPWSYVPLWLACLALSALLVERTLTARALRRLLGRRRFAFHPSGLWIVIEGESRSDGGAWPCDLGRPLLPPGPLTAPLAAFVCLVLLQLAPLPAGLVLFLNARQAELGDPGRRWLSFTLSPPDTLRGLAFLLSLLALHAVARALFVEPETRARFRRFLSLLGLALALFALGQMASGTGLIYGVFRPLEWDGTQTIFGPFVSRNHFAGYMLMVAPLGLGLAFDAARRYVLRLGPRANPRRALVGLQSPSGTLLIYALASALATLAALLASVSRAGILAFAAGMFVAGASVRGRTRTAVLALPLALGLLALAWFGTGRVLDRYEALVKVRPDRLSVWEDTLGRMHGLWALGSGFDTFSAAMSRVSVWKLPRGATPWTEPYEASVVAAPLAGYRTPAEIQGIFWYREAHNDYVQLLVETGLPGLLIALVALAVLLRAVRRDPWLLAAVAGVALHSLVDFDLQIPAISVLFAVVTALPVAAGADAAD